MTATEIIFSILCTTGAFVWLMMLLICIRVVIECFLKPPLRLPHDLDDESWAGLEPTQQEATDEITRRLHRRMSRISMGKDEPGRN